MLVLLIALAVVVSAGGLAASTLIRSPADEAAETAPPEATVLTAAVESTVVRDTVIIRGTVTAQHEYEVMPPASASGAQIVTAAPRSAGSAIVEGDVLAEVSGRPLLALGGTKPAHRDLAPGDDGYDVAQLQGSLASLGFDVDGDDFGVYGPRTKEAVSELYASRGYAAMTAGDPTALSAAEDEVDDARGHWKRLRADRTGGTTQVDVDAARAAVTEAQRRLDELERITGPMVPLSELVFLPSFPGVVVASGARVGAPVEPPLLTLAAGDLVVTGELNPADVAFVRAGMAASISGGTLSGTGAVAEVGAQVGSDGDATERDADDTSQPTRQPRGGTRVTVTPDEPIESNMVGADVQVTIESAASAGEVLAVPVAAVSSRADGNTYVTVLDGDHPVVVRVEVGLRGGGLVEVRPVDGKLRPGDRVVTGV